MFGFARFLRRQDRIDKSVAPFDGEIERHLCRFPVIVPCHWRDGQGPQPIVDLRTGDGGYGLAIESFRKNVETTAQIFQVPGGKTVRFLTGKNLGLEPYGCA